MPYEAIFKDDSGFRLHGPVVVIRQKDKPDPLRVIRMSCGSLIEPLSLEPMAPRRVFLMRGRINEIARKWGAEVAHAASE